MKYLDKYLQNERIKQARRFIHKNDRVLDIGSADGIMFEKWRGYISYGLGIDPTLPQKIEKDFYELIPGYFPEACPDSGTFDAITLLAVLEHIPTQQQNQFALNCHQYLKPGGKLIITVPSPRVDQILEILLKLRLIEGMSLEEHYGYKPSDTTNIFASPHFKLHTHETFQLGLNNLFVFERL